MDDRGVQDEGSGQAVTRASISPAHATAKGAAWPAEFAREFGKFALFRLSNRQACQVPDQSAIVARHFIRARVQLKHFPSVVLLAALLAPALGRAQLMLPGALQASPSSANKIAPNPTGATPGQPKPPGLKPPSEETIFGQELSRDGFAGIIAFRRGPSKGLEITRLSIAGEEISHPGE
ncbi:MAG TPA: hypothetical protein VHT48_04580, partial [Methylocella sp.]|nr:hypothetical protein [Methylocella sp.]